MKKRNLLCLCCMVLCLCLFGCSSEVQEEPTSSAAQLSFYANPQAAVDAIYETVTVKNVERLDEEQLERIGFNPEEIISHFVYWSEGTYGLADLYIIRPAAGCADRVRETLHEVKLERMQRFEKYDVLGAYDTAKNAQIFQQGDYIVMVMLPDSEAAIAIINEHMPIA